MKTQTAIIIGEEQKMSFGETPNFIRRPESKIQESQVLSYITSNLPEDSLETIARRLREETIPLNGKGTSPRFAISPSYFPVDRFVSLQKWEGVVMKVENGYFIARLHDLTSKGNEEEAEFSCEEISEDESELIVQGAIFYWNIGYHDSHTGQRTRASMIRFRRLPAWRQKEIDDSALEADKLMKSIGWK
ncbi:MAG: hypothetical protein BWX92_00583 [Deltaproteobacteria bacterium ADurb.Bin135]|jgi:hypothetical protein|nr:MAG: hypothetical protein BWX92_00583 [Deltaproteobacteria bacterium ADurb.Bin135]HPW35578.1 hypothetical protein [Syntrophorhabdus sp.]